MLEGSRSGRHTIDTRAVEDLAGFTGWTGSVAFDLDGGLVKAEMQRPGSSTFRLRQLLQFIASRGSLEMRRAGSRSIPICGLDIVEASDSETSVDMAKTKESGDGLEA